MPLKHNTETAMVFVLALMIALAGFASTFLPPVTVSILPWAVAFSLLLLYPLVLYPMMKENRADHQFRVLHFFPAGVLFVWLIVDLLAAFMPAFQPLQWLYTWGWSAAAVFIGFLLLLIFVFSVLRQKVKRVFLLLLVLLPFLALSWLSEYQNWDRKLANVLWDRSGSGAVLIGTSSGNITPSSDPLEEQWRAQLRAMERRRLQLARGEPDPFASSSAVSIEFSSSSASSEFLPSSSSSQGAAQSVRGALTGVIGMVLPEASSTSSVEAQSESSASLQTEEPSSSSSKNAQSSAVVVAVASAGSTSSKAPPQLPSSGPMETAGVLLLLTGALYMASVHRSTIVRSRR